MDTSDNKKTTDKSSADAMFGNENVMHTDENGTNYWSARELSKRMGYNYYEKFKDLINRAEKVASEAAVDINHHFIHADFPSPIGKGHTRILEDMHLTRCACHYIAKTAKKNNDGIKLARLYFHGAELLSTESITSNIEQKNTTYWYNLTTEVSKWYQEKMEKLDKVPDFKHDDSYLGNPAPNHRMYKLDTLKSADGCRGYEFLIEYDIFEPTVGIYYGCKGLIYKGDQDEQIKKMQAEYNAVKDAIIVTLNNTFPGKSFKHRLKPTNNANNHTYWHFWITLNEDEDIIEVGARATRMIRKIYELYFNGDLDTQFFKPCEVKLNTTSAFTFDAYNELIDKIGKKPENVELLERFLKRGCNIKRLSKVDLYEKAYMIAGDSENKDGINEAQLAYFITRLCKCMYGVSNVPWGNIEKIFLRKDGTPYNDTLKTYRKYIDLKKDENIQLKKSQSYELYNSREMADVDKKYDEIMDIKVKENTR